MESTSCGKCGRALKDPESIKRGIGPVCWSLIQAEHAMARGVGIDEKTRDQMLQDLGGKFKGDLVCIRNQRGEITVNIPRLIVRHSPDGYEWGYGGSGPAELALNALTLFIGYRRAQHIYQDFKREFIEPMPKGGGIVRRREVIRWTKEKEKDLKALP